MPPVAAVADLIDAREAARRLGVDAVVVLKLSADGVLHGRPDQQADGGFVVPAGEVDRLPGAVVDDARRYVEGLAGKSDSTSRD